MDDTGKKLVRIMARACDRTKAHKNGVIVQTAGWYALMALASQAEQHAASSRTE